MRHKTHKRTQGKKHRKRTFRGGLSCPPGTPPRMCEKYIQKWKNRGMDPQHVVTPNFKTNLEQTLRNRERRLTPEEVRIADARAKFNWKSRVPRFNAIRRGEINNNNLSNNELQNIHEATNFNFPEPTGRPQAFNTIIGPPALGSMRKKIYRNNVL